MLLLLHIENIAVIERRIRFSPAFRGETGGKVYRD